MTRYDQSFLVISEKTTCFETCFEGQTAQWLLRLNADVLRVAQWSAYSQSTLSINFVAKCCDMLVACVWICDTLVKCMWQAQDKQVVCMWYARDTSWHVYDMLSQARGRRRCRPTPSGPWLAMMSIAGATRVCSTLRAAATPSASTFRWGVILL